MDELTREFLIESQEGLDRMERCLTDLEERPQDFDLLGEIFRAVHTIKGTTGFLGFKRLEKLAHAGENLLGLLRDGQLSANQSIITGLLQLLDGLRSILRTIEGDNHEGEGEDTQLITLMHDLQHPPAHADSASLGTTKSVPEVKHAAAGQVHEPGSDSGSVGLQAAPAASMPAVPDADTAPKPTVLPPAEKAKLVQHPPAHPAAGSLEGAGDNPASASVTKTKAAGSASDSTLRVDVVLLNRMMNLVGELVLTRNQILQATSHDPNLTLLSRRLDMVTADLRESVMRARMQPVSNVFSKFPRIIRDLSQMLNRRVKLVLEGQETELDKSLLEAIKDPLTHAVRNSLDHGIETPEKRIANGKDPEGTLKLRAYQESSHVIIEVSDDGAGIGVERVRAKAIERGLITAERAALLAERELLQLIFLPGFSTAEAVTNVSGRGVGMDVVRTNVEKIGGKVEIESRAGKGTTLRLRIPLTLAIIPALIVRSLEQSFALPQGSLSELVHVPANGTTTTIEWMEGAPLYRLRGQLLPLIFLDHMLEQPHALGSASRTERGAQQPRFSNQDMETARRQRNHFIAVLDVEGRKFGLVVDGLADPEEIVVKPLSNSLKSIGIYSGATVLGSGDLALILDPSAIASRAGVTMQGGEDAVETAAAGSAMAPTAPQYLLLETGNRRAAVPLGDVLRIESVPRSRIEYIGYRAVLNFEGQLLPVEDPGGALNAEMSSPDSLLTVVVCRDGHRQVGIAVTQVLDVAGGSDLYESGSQHAAGGVMLVNEQVTGIINLTAIDSLQLGVQSQLPQGSNWDQYTETLA